MKLLPSLLGALLLCTPAFPAAYLEPTVVQSGHSTSVSWPDMPWTLQPNVIREEVYTARVPAGRPWRISTFIGVDQGDLGEFAIDIAGEDGTRVYQRSMHKEAVGIYDGWDRVLVNPAAVFGRVTIHLLGHVTGHQGRAHFEIIFEE